MRFGALYTLSYSCHSSPICKQVDDINEISNNDRNFVFSYFRIKLKL